MSLSPLEVIELTEEIPVFCVKADSFPDGILPAHQKLHSIVPLDTNRRYFGISWGGDQITYKAAATELFEGELKEKNLERFAIRKGKYLATIANSPQDIAEAFQKLLDDPRLLPDGYCVESYLSDNKIQCMVTIED
jgi:hypothetical protein